MCLCGFAAYRIEFATTFWLQNVPALGNYPEHARTLLLDTLKLKVTDEQRIQVHRFVVRLSLDLDDVKSAEEHTRLLTRAIGHGVGDESLLEIAVHQIGKQRYAEARDLLVKMLRVEKPQRWTSRARLLLAEPGARSMAVAVADALHALAQQRQGDSETLHRPLRAGN